MRDYAKVAPMFWTGETGRKLRGHADAQVLALYLLTCPSAQMIGCYYLPRPMIAHETGLSADRAAAALAHLEAVGFARYDEDTEHVYIEAMAAYQVGDALKITDRGADKRIAGVVRELRGILKTPFARPFWDRYHAAYQLPAFESLLSPSEGASEGHGSKEKEKEQLKENENAKGKEKEQEKPAAPAPVNPRPSDGMKALPSASSLVGPSELLQKLSATYQRRYRVPYPWTDGDRSKAGALADEIGDEQVVSRWSAYVAKDDPYLTGKTPPHCFALFAKQHDQHITAPAIAARDWKTYREYYEEHIAFAREHKPDMVVYLEGRLADCIRRGIADMKHEGAA